jgi:hypothetical protein
MIPQHRAGVGVVSSSRTVPARVVCPSEGCGGRGEGSGGVRVLPVISREKKGASHVVAGLIQGTGAAWLGFESFLNLSAGGMSGWAWGLSSGFVALGLARYALGNLLPVRIGK